MKLEPDDLQSLEDTVDILESSSSAIELTNLIGKPIEHAVNTLPASVSRRIDDTTRSALQSSLRVAVSTMNNERFMRPSYTVHKVLTTLSGAVGGAFGLPALAIELPVSTTIMLRSIADIARGEGENIRLAKTQLACIEVFALGGSSLGCGSFRTGGSGAVERKMDLSYYGSSEGILGLGSWVGQNNLTRKTERLDCWDLLT